MKIQPRRMGLLIVALLLFIPVALLQRGIDPIYQKNYAPSQSFKQGAKNLPVEMALGAFTGFREAVAGMLWVRCDEFFHNGDYEAIMPLIRVITWLDPHQIDVYETGAWHMDYNFTDSSERSDRRYIPFSLSLLGTFLVRSGVLTSVHAFATDPRRGVFILVFLAIVIGGSLTLYAWRAPQLGLGKAPRDFSPTSRESLLLANNVLLVVAMLAVVLGTLYPLFLDALKLGKISVGPPYFDAVFYPLMAPALFLMAVGPISRWRNSTLPDLVSRLKWAFGIAVASGIVIPLLMGKWTPMIALGLLLATWIIAACVTALAARFQATPGKNFFAKIAANRSSYYGMHLAHRRDPGKRFRDGARCAHDTGPDGNRRRLPIQVCAGR